MESVVIVSSCRTAIGSFQGSLGTTPAPQLGAQAIQAALTQANVSADQVDECIMGNVLTAGIGQAPARQAAIFAGLKTSVPCMTINKVCGSGLKAVMLASDSVRLGRTRVAVAGGQENMSLAPHLMENSRTGYRMGHVTLNDSMIKDGLWDPYNNFHMGSAAEICVRDYKLSREEQDQFAIESYKKAQTAIEKGLFAREIAPVKITVKKETVLFAKDEDPFKTQFDKIPTLRPAFEKDGTITAANASKINDGGAAHILMSESTAQKMGLKPLARIVAQSVHAQEPKHFTTAPVGAIQKVLQEAQLTANDIDLWEINEAFAVVTQVAMKELKIAADRVNVHGGAIALGHPIGASGARVLATLVHALHTRQAKRGLATLCIGGGEAVALIVERM